MLAVTFVKLGCPVAAQETAAEVRSSTCSRNGGTGTRSRVGCG